MACIYVCTYAPKYNLPSLYNVTSRYVLSADSLTNYDTNEYPKLGEENPRIPQPYTMNYRQLKKAGIRKGGLTRGKKRTNLFSSANKFFKDLFPFILYLQVFFLVHV